MNNLYIQHSPIIGKRLFALAVAWGRSTGSDLPGTQADRDAKIKGIVGRKTVVNGSRSIRAAREATEAAANAIAAVRHARNALRQRIAYRNSSRNAGMCQRGRAVLPAGSPSSRIAEKRERALLGAAADTLRNYEREVGSIIVPVLTLSDAGVSLRTERGWIEYSKGYGNRQVITEAQYTFRAMLRCPLPRNIGGLLTLAASEAPELAAQGERVFAAVWASQGRSEPERNSGWIIERAGQYAHAKTLGAARAVLARRIDAPARAASLARWQEAVRKALEAGQIDGYDIPVTFRDATHAGLCSPGIRAWTARNFPGVDPDTGSVQVSQILAIQHDQREFALAACLSAIHRHQRHGLRQAEAA